MKNLQIPTGVEWEVLVVNNNSTDNTDEVIGRHTTSLPLRRLHEPRQGQSNARNHALTEAAGELILWTDDDVLLGPEWIAQYVRAAMLHPKAAYFGGPI